MAGSAHPIAVVHGRFQPFHVEHLAYSRLGLARGEVLVVGITTFGPRLVVPEPANPERRQVVTNLFTYWERALMIRDALLEDGIAPEQFLIVAFPIHQRERLAAVRAVQPGSDRVHRARLFGLEGAEKVRRLRAAGLGVEPIREAAKRLSGREVRARGRHGLGLGAIPFT